MIIEIVCHANVCRSPVAAALLQSQTGLQVRSSGLHASSGQLADPNMVEMLDNEFPSLRTHRASRFDVEIARSAELILVMEVAQKTQIVSAIPQAAGKTMLFGHWLDDQREIEDPYGREPAVYLDAIARLRSAASAWTERLSGAAKR